ncbi:MAG: ABC transporter ATP-binding protein [Erysipelotrichales bacterium]
MLKINNLSKTFNAGTANEKKALQNIDLELKKGDFVTVIGSNGAGKSTILNMIAGAFMMDCGSILLDGENISLYPEYKRARLIGRVFQDPMLGSASDMNIEENLAMANRRGKRRGLRWGIAHHEEALFKDKLKGLDLGLEERLKTKIGLLSGGQRQAITLLMASLQQPKLLLLDEHTAALDPKTASKVLNLTQEIVEEQQLTTFMVTHNMKDAIKYGNRLIMMHDGKIILDISGEQKKSLSVSDLLERFEQTIGSTIDDDEILLSNK